jgi:hypothetical protein
MNRHDIDQIVAQSHGSAHGLDLTSADLAY